MSHFILCLSKSIWLTFILSRNVFVLLTSNVLYKNTRVFPRFLTIDFQTKGLYHYFSASGRTCTQKRYTRILAGRWLTLQNIVKSPIRGSDPRSQRRMINDMQLAIKALIVFHIPRIFSNSNSFKQTQIHFENHCTWRE